MRDPDPFDYRPGCTFRNPGNLFAAIVIWLLIAGGLLLLIF
ncbi:MAG: hypothetical protein WC130_05845 [Kiritimatiellia bacterium]|jgi:hypothetical protein